jgi:phosphate transport system permease protein
MAGPHPTPVSLPARNTYRRRRAISAIMTGVLVLCGVLALAPLFAVVGYVLQQGWSTLVGHFPSIMTVQAPAGGQLLEGLKGTIILIILACAVGLPIGILSGLFLAEYGRNRFGDVVRFVSDVLAGLPSIIAGIVAYSLLVLTTKQFTAFAGGVALGLLMFPTVTRTTEAAVRLVPDDLREAGLALGVRRWRTVVSVVIPTALNGIITGVILGIARVAGETAPLIFTAFGNNNGFLGLTQPTPALPLQIFVSIASPVDPSQDYPLAYAAVLLLFLLVLVLNLSARAIGARRMVKGR